MARKRRVSEHHEEHMDESWLVPYADILTLLLALFIVLFATSSLDKAKYNAVMEAMYQAFNGETTEAPSGGEGGVAGLPYPAAGLPEGAINELLESIPPMPSQDASDGEGQERLGNLYSSLINYVDNNGLQDEIDVDYQGDDVLVTLRNDINYASANADVSPEMHVKAQMLAKILEDNEDDQNPFDVIVAGHTDDIPIQSAEYPSNWALSVDRAQNFLTALLEDENLDPTRFSIRGYGEYDPVASNDSADGRAKNRRVELLISQKLLQGQEDTAQATQSAQADAVDSTGTD